VIGWLGSLLGRVVTQQQSRVDALETLGREAIDTAADQWHFAIHDPKRSDNTDDARRSKSMIDAYIRKGLGWTWEPPYAGDGDFEWCGAFAAYCWLSIKPALRKQYFASTFRLDRFARYGSVNGEKNKGTGRLLAELDENSKTLPWEPRAGDILLIGPKGSGYGKHICLVESFDGKDFKTIEGNGYGLAPNGKVWQGVIRNQRRLGAGDGWHARRLIRPSPEDLSA
jgi:hypothetical protein